MVSGDTHLDPIILGETSFFQYGREIQDLLASRFQGSTVLLIGLSMTDPNVVAPLRITNAMDDEGRRYLFNVPPIDRRAGADLPEVESAASFATTDATMFSRDLRVHTIMLKSYGQLIQLVSDLALEASLTSPSTRRAHADTYGTRFSSALESAYESIGLDSRVAEKKKQKSAIRLSKKMRTEARKPPGKSPAHGGGTNGGPLWLLDELRSAYPGDCATEEKFGIFLWLRETGASTHRSRYRVRLVAASTYFHWEAWSNRISEPISAESKYTPASACYYGRPVFRNIEAGVRGIWRGSLALPLVQYGATYNESTLLGNWIDQLTIGAIAINSTSPVQRVGSMQRSAMSVLYSLDAEHINLLHASIYQYAERVFSGELQK